MKPKNIEAWFQDLMDFTGISKEQAQEIANHRADHVGFRVREMEAKNSGRFSKNRQRQIDLLLKRDLYLKIKDRNHAVAIIEAYNRHVHFNKVRIK